MFYLLLVIIGISFFWELSFTDDTFLSLLQTGWGSAMWGAAALYLYDFQFAIRGRSSPYIVDFYSQIKNDVFICLAIGLSLVLLYTLAPSTYSFYNVDLAFLGMPFLLYSLAAVLSLKRAKIGKTRLLRGPIYGLLALLVVGYVLFFFWAVKIINSSYSQSQALWMQITIFSTGLYAFIASKFMRFAVEKERLEIFPSLRNTLSRTKRGRHMYDELAKNVERWNAAVEKQKREEREASRKATRDKKSGGNGRRRANNRR